MCFKEALQAINVMGWSTVLLPMFPWLGGVQRDGFVQALLRRRHANSVCFGKDVSQPDLPTLPWLQT